MRKVARGSALRPRIRVATGKDLPSLIALENMCFKEETFHKKKLEYLLTKAKSMVLVASSDDDMIGSIIILLRKNIGNARIYSLNVHPEHRRIGIAGSLMDTSERILIERGFKNITLEVGINNHAAQNLYWSKGFLVDKRLKKYYENGDDALHLVKKL